MRYVLGVFGILILMILAVVLIARRGPNETATTVQTGNKQVSLADYEDKPAMAILTVRGEVTGDEQRRGIRITVSAQERDLEILKGYNETVESRQSFPNNNNAYANFLSALDAAGFSREQATDIKDDRGVCPLGQRYDYKLQDGSEEVFRFWNTSCGSKQGNFGGNGIMVRRLFENQIPDYRILTRGVEL